MAKATNKKPGSNVIPLPTGKKALATTHFPITGDVMPVGGDPKKDRTPFNAVLDFSDVDMKDLYRMAAQTIVIKLAGNCRSKFEATKDKKTGKRTGDFRAIVAETFPKLINVKAGIVPKMRANAKVRKADKIVKDVENMSDADRAAMFAKLSALMPKAKK